MDSLTAPASPAPRFDPDVAELLERTADLAARNGNAFVESWCDDIAAGRCPESDLYSLIDQYDMHDDLGLTPPWKAEERYGVRRAP